MKTGYKLSHGEKKIIVSKDFLVRSGCFGTPEFDEMSRLRVQFPNYMVEEYQIEKNPNKQTYGKLTYEYMVDYIKGKEPADQRDQVLSEFELVKKYSKAQRASYAYVKKWFLNRYKDAFKTKKQMMDEVTAELLTNGNIIDISEYMKANA